MSKNNKRKNRGYMYDVNLIKQAGVDPAAIIPQRRLGVMTNCDSERLKKILKIVDRQDAVTRFVWYNLPKGLTGELIEQVLYQRGQGGFVKVGDTYYFLPYTLRSEGNSGIDCYGRYKYVTFVPMGSTDVKGKSSSTKLFGGKEFKVIYDIEPKMNVKVEDKAIILRDYVNRLTDDNIDARDTLNEVLLDIESRMFPYAETAVLSKTGVKGIKVTSEAEAEDVNALNSSIKYGALNQEMMFGIKAAQDLQDFASESGADVSQYLELFQSLENFRKSLYGTPSGGLMQKQSHMLENESKMNQANNISQGNDALYQRQLACVLFYSLTGQPIWCDIRKTANPEDNQTALVTDNKGGSTDDNTK